MVIVEICTHIFWRQCDIFVGNYLFIIIIILLTMYWQIMVVNLYGFEIFFEINISLIIIL